MRIHLSPDVIRLLATLREEGAGIRAAIEAIRRNPDQPDAIQTLERPGRRELHVRIGNRGYWIIYRIKRDRGETQIDITAIEQN
jgi:hypothetical protein